MEPLNIAMPVFCNMSFYQYQVNHVSPPEHLVPLEQELALRDKLAAFPVD